MIIQVSSGQGPAECELAVRLLCESLQEEYPDMEMLSKHGSRFSEGYASALLYSEEDLSELEGTVQWICRSPLRPSHKRKNWFVDVSLISEEEKIVKDGDIRLERFHSGGKGGQNVNKVETGGEAGPCPDRHQRHIHRAKKPEPEQAGRAEETERHSCR